MIAPFECRITISAKCGFCETNIIVFDELLLAGNDIPKPSLPAFWRIVDGRPLCLDHVISIQRVKLSK